ncbi:hypothetical protein ACWDSJ_34270 [Nocardia sp. NPDC003482]
MPHNSTPDDEPALSEPDAQPYEEILAPHNGDDASPFLIDENVVPARGTVGATVGEPLHQHRFGLARWLIALVAIIAIALIIAIIFAPTDHLAAVKFMVPIIFTPLASLLTYCVAWYFFRKSP